MDLSPISKAVAGGVVTAVVAEFARFGFHLGQPYIDAVGVLATGIAAYLIGHLFVYLAPANRPKL